MAGGGAVFSKVSLYFRRDYCNGAGLSVETTIPKTDKDTFHLIATETISIL